MLNGPVNAQRFPLGQPPPRFAWTIWVFYSPSHFIWTSSLMKLKQTLGSQWPELCCPSEPSLRLSPNGSHLHALLRPVMTLHGCHRYFGWETVLRATRLDESRTNQQRSRETKSAVGGNFSPFFLFPFLLDTWQRKKGWWPSTPQRLILRSASIFKISWPLPLLIQLLMAISAQNRFPNILEPEFKFYLRRV